MAEALANALKKIEELETKNLALQDEIDQQKDNFRSVQYAWETLREILG